MIVWELLPDSEQYTEYFLPIEEDIVFFDDLFDSHISKGIPVGDLWKPLTLVKRTQRKFGDVAYFNDYFSIFSEDCRSIFSEFLPNEFEWLPVSSSDGVMYFANFILQVNCLNLKSSKLIFSEVSKHILEIQEPVLLREKVSDLGAFKIAHPFYYYQSFVTDIFRKIWESRGFTGLDFSEENLFWKSNDYEE